MDAAAAPPAVPDAASAPETVPGKPYLLLCAKDWKQQQCCDFLCQCLDKTCSGSPSDKPRLAACMPMCLQLSDQRARCQVYHCYEALNPATLQDFSSHCGTASGRIAGGSCPAFINQ